MFLTSDFSKRYEKLPVKIFNEQKEASKVIVRDVMVQAKKKAAEGKNLVLALAASSACLQVYDDFIAAVKEKKMSFKNIEVFGMDDYYPLDRNELQSHYRFLKECLLDDVDIPAKNVHFIDSSKRDNTEEYCQSYEKEIEKAGGIDIVITGNMAMNEPGSPYNSRTRKINLNFTTRVGAASEFFGVDDVPYYAITMGIATILEARKIYYLSWGEGSAPKIKKIVEGEVTKMVPASYLQEHGNAHIIVDRAAAVNLTRVETPWLTDKVTWTPYLIRKSVFWLCRKLDKPILKLTDRDYNDNGMSDLVTEKGPASQINIKVFNDLQHIISGWPGGKPNTDDSTRPERALPYPKRVVVFSPHPDDDVISMGGTLARLAEHGHDIHVAYQTSGNIAVFDHDVIRYLDFIRESADIFDIDPKNADALFKKIEKELAKKHPGQADPLIVRRIKTYIRRGEARSACRYLGIPDDHVNFLSLPFYETGGVKKKPLGKKDIEIVKKLLQRIKPHQIFAAGDLSDPHGTHRVCFQAVIKACEELKDEPWFKDCRIWMYRGAWQEWDVAEAEMAVPLSPEEVKIKRSAIFRHQSQKDYPLFPGSDSREFWLRAEERNHNTAVIFDKLGMAEYQAIELFVKYKF
ncbi:MAG: glucosamine-6-phosphate deaminase [Bacteroidales bacterium]|jgi:glucosamine-6-phosphate deaminase|nr:glucosamine-6-phosphate deaminase [Bacteroidales bacterium]